MMRRKEKEPIRLGSLENTKTGLGNEQEGCKEVQRGTLLHEDEDGVGEKTEDGEEAVEDGLVNEKGRE
jgi:hypothetical protein